jgi:hypothetical protein
MISLTPSRGAPVAAAAARRRPSHLRRRAPARVVAGAGAGASSTPSSSSSSPSPGPGRPVVVFAIDDTEAAARALEWTATALCGGDGADLRLLHVVCDARASATSIGVTNSGRTRRDASELADRRDPVVLDHEKRLVSAARAMIERRCRAAGVALPAAEGALMLPVAPGAKSAALIGATVCRAARSAGPGAALVVPSHGPGALADFGSVARYCYQRALAEEGSQRAAGGCSTLVLVPPASAAEASRSRRVVLAARSPSELEALAAWSAANLFRSGADEVVVISVVEGGGDGKAAYELSAGAREALTARGATVAAAAAATVVAAAAAATVVAAAWQQAVLDAAAGARCLVMLEDEQPATSGEAETFESKMQALMGGGGGLSLDEGEDSGSVVSGDASCLLADYASRRATVPLVVLRRKM